MSKFNQIRAMLEIKVAKEHLQNAYSLLSVQDFSTAFILEIVGTTAVGMTDENWEKFTEKRSCEHPNCKCGEVVNGVIAAMNAFREYVKTYKRDENEQRAFNA